jgi:soluble lytic murein transglycosylase
MSTRTTRSSAPARSRARPAHGPTPVQRRRRIAGVIGFIVVAILAATWIAPRLNHAVRDLTLPLRDQDIIRAQAAQKHLDPALIAAVIYAETKFVPRTSSAGAEGLMQLEPDTAKYLAHLSGGYAFKTSDLDTPAVNIAYGSYYLRYLLDHYGGDKMLAVAAYNAGATNVDGWVAAAHARGHNLTVAAIPFGETRAYVARVLQAEHEYATEYPIQLGL